jgi:hypothetical protein
MKKALRQRLLLGTALPLLLTSASGCRDVLESAATPQGTLNETTLQNLTGIEGSLVATYRALDWNGAVGGGWGNSASNWAFGSVPSDDAYKGSEATDQPAVDDLERYQWGTAGANDYLNDKWRGAYEGVVRANATLGLLDGVVTARPTEIPAAVANSIRGEAILLRAHYHFEAYRMWGNVPYYRVADRDFRKANSPAAEVVQNLLVDLDSAIALLPAAPRNGNVGRVSQWTAKAYKGRVLAYAAQWPAALTTLREVQASGVYDLEESFDRVWTGFSEFSNKKETILAYQASANDGEPNGNNANYGERLNFPHSGSPFGCCGFHQPSQNLVNFYSVDASGLPLALSAPAAWNTRNDNLTASASASLALDPRLDWTVGRDGVPYKDWGPHAPSWIRAPTYGGPYSGKKIAYEKASGAASTVGWAPAQLSSANIHLFRYADLLLLLAEAEVEAGSLENARTIVNGVRTRAGVRVQGPGTDRATLAVPINSPSITWARYQVGTYPASAFAGQAAARERVRAERRLELALEGQRFFDLRRWSTAAEVLNAYVAVERTRRPLSLTAAATYEARHRYFPIPQIQIDLSKQGGKETLTQNTGW